MFRLANRFLVASLLLTAVSTVLASAQGGGAEDEPFFESERFWLVREDGVYSLRSNDGVDLVVADEWLRPADVVAEEEVVYVSSLDWDQTVTSFPIDGLLEKGERLGLHLSSYTVAEGGSAMAAAGRDLFLVLERLEGQPDRLELGLDLGNSKGRVRVGGCFAARFHRVLAGDVDCDRRLDLAVVEERLTCEPVASDRSDSQGDGAIEIDAQFHRVAPRRWFVLSDARWAHDASLDDRLPCFGMREVPLIGLKRSPIEFLLGRYGEQPPLVDAAGRATRPQGR